MLHEFCTYIYDHGQCTVPVSAFLGHDRDTGRHDDHEGYHYDFPHTTGMKLSGMPHDATDTIVTIDIKENNNSSHSQHPTPTPTRQQHQHPYLSFSSPPLVIRNV